MLTVLLLSSSILSAHSRCSAPFPPAHLPSTVWYGDKDDYLAKTEEDDTSLSIKGQEGFAGEKRQEAIVSRGNRVGRRERALQAWCT